jgi:hypothetical protein
MTIGGSDREATAARVLSKVKHRLKSGALSGDKQQWFQKGDVEAAESAVRKILSAARTRALVVDPYFGADDVKLWLPTIGSGATEVQVLTSVAGLRQRSVARSLADRQRELEELEKLRNEIRAAAAEGLLNRTTVRVMMGASPAVHDRFLVADETIWLLGSSLNSFGTRGTMLVQLPLPLAVLPNLEQVWTGESIPLDDAISQFSSEKEGAGK